MPHLIRMRWGMGSAPAEIEVCAATRRERHDEGLDFVRSGGRLLVEREWEADGLAFGEYSLDLDCLDDCYRSYLLRMGFECFEACHAQGCEGIPPFKVGCVYICDEWKADIPRAAADLRARWMREVRVTPLRI